MYEITDFLGEGGFAYVFRAMDANLEIDVALKVLKPNFAHDPVFEKNFRREAHRAAKFRHPNVVAIHFAGRDDDVVFFSMDLLEHGLDEIMDGGTAEEKGILKVGMDVSSALDFAHTFEGGLVHRDLKPDNIRFDRHGNAVVTDFGIAEAATNYTQATGTTVFIGTPLYMSPEQARGRKVNHLSDIYSLGATLYELAVGRTPFEGQDWFELGRKHIEEPPPPPRQNGAEISEGLERVILRCLEKEPEDRYESAGEVGDALQKVLGGTSAPTVVLPEQQEELKEREERRKERKKERAAPEEGEEGEEVPTAGLSQGWSAALGTLVLLVILGIGYRFDVAGVQTAFPALQGVPLIGGGGTVYVEELSVPLVEGEPDVSGEITLALSGGIDPSTATSEAVRLLGPDGAAVPSRVRARSRTLTLVPRDSLRFETEYRLELAGLASSGGRPVKLASGVGAAFTTRPAPPDHDPPRLASEIREKFSEEVPATATVLLRFNEPVDPSTVSSSSVQLLDSDGDALTADVMVDATDGRRTTLLPEQPLQPRSRYVVHFDSTIADLAGNSLVRDSLVIRTGSAAEEESEEGTDRPQPVTLAVSRGSLPDSLLERFTVYVDGERAGSPPVRQLAAGGRSHSIRIVGTPPFSGPDQSVVVYQRTVPAGAPRRIDMGDVRGFGTISLNTSPGGIVLVDGEEKGQTPPGVNITLLEGTHTLEIRPVGPEAESYRPYTTAFELEAFEERSFRRIELPEK